LSSSPSAEVKWNLRPLPFSTFLLGKRWTGDGDAGNGDIGEATQEAGTFIPTRQYGGPGDVSVVNIILNSHSTARRHSALFLQGDIKRDSVEH
jgi:hypothetical protein